MSHATTGMLNQNIGEAVRRQLTAMLRRRFLWLCGVWIALTASQYLWHLARPVIDSLRGEPFPLPAFDLPQLWMMLFGELGRLTVLAGALWLVYRRCRTRQDILRVAFWTLIIIGFSTLAARIDPAFIGAGDEAINAATSNGRAASPMVSASSSIALAHLFMCLFLPWTPRQAAGPLFVLVPAWFVASWLAEGFTEAFILHGFLLGPSVSGAGLFICWIRHRHLRKRMETNVLRRHFREAQRELIDARRIHEARFPRPIQSGAVRLEYDYEPMREIGGDFLHLRRDDAGAVHGAIIDVTGHGITAALAVNRIDGELARLVAEDPQRPPDEVLALLNRFIHLTMARHCLYATAFCFRIAPNGRARWTNGGHPPAFVRRADGRVESLDSTTFILGACPPDAFSPEARETTLKPGENLVVYTDGACEAVDRRQRPFGIQGIRQALERWNPDAGIGLVPFLPQAVRTYRAGSARDDVLFTVASYVGESSTPTISSPRTHDAVAAASA